MMIYDKKMSSDKISSTVINKFDVIDHFYLKIWLLRCFKSDVNMTISYRVNLYWRRINYSKYFKNKNYIWRERKYIYIYKYCKNFWNIFIAINLNNSFCCITEKKTGTILNNLTEEKANYKNYPLNKLRYAICHLTARLSGTCTRRTYTDKFPGNIICQLNKQIYSAVL